MAEIEVYADTMTGFSISKDATVAKLVLSSSRPTATGKMEDVPVAIVTMPVRAMQEMLTDIQNAVGQHQAGVSGPRN